MRKLFLLICAVALPVSAVTVDRVAAVIDRQVITVSEVSADGGNAVLSARGQAER